MNIHSEIPARPDKEQRLAALEALEGDIADLRNMTLILYNLMEEELREYRNGEWTCYPKDGEAYLNIQLNSDQMDMLFFAKSNLLGRVIDLHKKFHAAFEGGNQ